MMFKADKNMYIQPILIGFVNQYLIPYHNVMVIKNISKKSCVYEIAINC